MKEINVLNHGSIRLVEHMGNDLSIVRSARVSYNADWRPGGDDVKLINYLVKNRHTSPFESVVFTFEVKAPIFVFRQWHRHRTWCLAGDTMLEFVRPCDGKPYKKSIAEIEASWNPKKAVRRRFDQSEMSLEEHNRERISNMRIRCMGASGEIEETSIVDVWKSGVKKVFKVSAGGKTIRASADHLFFSDGEWVRVAELHGRNVTLLHRAGCAPKQKFPEFTEGELATEQWHEFADGYRVSNLGRVQTRWGQGSRTKREWRDKKPVINPSGRVVVSVRKNSVVQVSRLVAEAFVDGVGVVVRHNDDNALDNRACNLAWGSHQDNREDSIRNGGMQKRAWVSVPVENIVEDGEEVVYDMTVAHSEHNFVASNFLVHNCFNEISARYSELPEEFYIPEVSQITTQSKSNKQMRTDVIHPDADHIQDDISGLCKHAFTVYHGLLKRGCPRELARGVLPVNTFSRMYATVDLHNLAHFLRLRLHEHSQYEIRVYAQAMLELIEPVVPVCVDAYRKHALL